MRVSLTLRSRLIGATSRPRICRSTNESVKQIISTRTTYHAYFRLGSVAGPAGARSVSATGIDISPPHFPGGLSHQPQFRFLIHFGQQIALHRRRETALRAYREPLQRHISGSFLDAALQLALAFGFGLLRADQSEHYGAVFRHLGQRFETARALVIEFEQEAIEARLAKNFRNRSVISPRVKLALIVAPTQV